MILDLPDIVQILVEADAIARRELGLEGSDLTHNGIEQAATLLLPRQPVLASASVTE